MVEDAISGLKSGHAADALTLAVCTSTSKEVIVNSGANPNYVVSDLTNIGFSVRVWYVSVALVIGLHTEIENKT